ncbi:MAG: SsrA-binding protein SmpB [Bradymonadales bacterium]|nr:MAG: SsrA-binding protein SmpB [Bradymonadales bacterium]
MSEKLITENRKARFNYHIEETLEAGVVLKGSEVKSCREGKMNLSDAYGAFQGDELYLMNAHINEYSHGNRFNHEPRARRKLLLHRKELSKWFGAWTGGKTIVALKAYLKGGRVKVLLGLGKGKKIHDKRQDLKKKQADREISRELRSR